MRGAETMAAPEKRARAGTKARDIEKDIMIFIRRVDQCLAERLKVKKINFGKESRCVTGGIYKSTARKYANYLSAGLMALLGGMGFYA